MGVVINFSPWFDLVAKTRAADFRDICNRGEGIKRTPQSGKLEAKDSSSKELIGVWLDWR